MEELQIPDKFKHGFELLVSIENKTVETLIDALKQASPSLIIEDLASAVASQVQALTEEEVVDIIDALVSLYNFREYSSTSIDKLIEGISQAVQGDEELPNISDEQKREFERRLATFLEFDGVLSVTSKAIDVVRDHERIFTGSRILSDMRPIFESDLEKGPAGVAIVHMLKIEYADLEGKHEFFVALDSIDVEQLRQQLDRADRKAKAIGMMLNKANISYLNYPDVDRIKVTKMPVAEKEKIDSWIQNPNKSLKSNQLANLFSKNNIKRSKAKSKNEFNRDNLQRINQENSPSPRCRKYGLVDRYRYTDFSRDVDLETTFINLVNQWREENHGVSSTNKMSMHPAYQQIIGMGKPAIPLLLRELEKKSGHWFWALKSISREDPVPPEYRGKVKEMIKVWLEWGKNRGYKW